MIIIRFNSILLFKHFFSISSVYLLNLENALDCIRGKFSWHQITLHSTVCSNKMFSSKNVSIKVGLRCSFCNNILKELSSCNKLKFVNSYRFCKLWYFKLWPFDLADFIFWNIKCLQYRVAKIQGLKYQSSFNRTHIWRIKRKKLKIFTEFLQWNFLDNLHTVHSILFSFVHKIVPLTKKINWIYFKQLIQKSSSCTIHLTKSIGSIHYIDLVWSIEPVFVAVNFLKLSVCYIQKVLKYLKREKSFNFFSVSK